MRVLKLLLLCVCAMCVRVWWMVASCVVDRCVPAWVVIDGSDCVCRTVKECIL